MKTQNPKHQTPNPDCACDICIDLPAALAGEHPEPTTLSAWLAAVSPARVAEALAPALAALN